jgi:hypothetical protein
MKPTQPLCGKFSVDAHANYQSAGWLSSISLGPYERLVPSIRYTPDFLPLTISASAGKLIVPLTKYLRAASATACFTVGS